MQCAAFPQDHAHSMAEHRLPLLVKAAVLVLGALGIAGMWLAVFADVGVAMLAVLNSMRAMGVKRLALQRLDGVKKKSKTVILDRAAYGIYGRTFRMRAL